MKSFASVIFLLIRLFKTVFENVNFKMAVVLQWLRSFDQSQSN